MGALIPLIPLAAIPNCGGRRVFKNDQDLAVFRVDNAVYAIQDSCPHHGAWHCHGQPLPGSTSGAYSRR